MAEVARTAQVPTPVGIVPTVIEGMSAADVQIIPNKNANNILRVVNGGSETTKVTIVTPNEVGGNPIADREIEVAAGATKLIGPFDKATYNNRKGNLEVKFSKVTSVKLEITQISS
jgi:hypothetical protein